MSKAEKKVEMEYLSPMQAHAAMEPLCATASVTPEGCEIWAPTPDYGAALRGVRWTEKAIQELLIPRPH